MRGSLSSLCAAIALAAIVAPASAADPGKSPYAGQQVRAIKALSEEDIAALRNGDGMALAKAAELNGYPGPRHVLELTRELDLTEVQRREATAIRERMSTAAQRLGAELIEREGLLDQLFAHRDITPETLAAATSAIGETQAKLRAVHLAAHLEMRAVLSPEQVVHYDVLRGYADGAAKHDPREHKH